MSETARCPQCQAEIPAGAPEGMCPQCLLQAGLRPPTGEAEQKTAAYSPAGPGFVPPALEVLQSAFPQLEILELLGKGGMGAVYKARQLHLDRLVAVKILSPDVSQDPAFAERFTREARTLAKLSHPNIVGIHDFGQASGFCYFVMEFMDGVNLRHAMRAAELTPAEALKIVPQICDALQFAHDEGIVHRDIKPENILLDKKGRVKIADFGLAKLLGKAPYDVSLTGTQQVMGTMHYIAPEQLKGSRDVDHRADIYSLGVTFYEMLTGELPLGRFAPPSKKVQIDVRLDEVVLRSLEREPEQRYQHASEIKTEMETIAREPAAAKPAPAPFGAPVAEQTAAVDMRSPNYRRTVVYPVLALSLVGLVASIIVSVLGWRLDENPVASGTPFLAFWALLILSGVWLWRTGMAWHGLAVAGSKIVPVLGGLNLVFAMALFGIASAEYFAVSRALDSVESRTTLLQQYNWDLVDNKRVVRLSSALHFLGAAGLLVGGIGLLMGRRWGHHTSLSFAVLEAVHCAVMLAAMAIYLAVTVHTYRFDAFAADIMAVFIMFSIFFLAQIIILTRPGIIAAFRQPAEQLAPVVESKFNEPPPLSKSHRARFEHANEVKTGVETIAPEPIAASAPQTAPERPNAPSSVRPWIVPVLGLSNFLAALALLGMATAEFVVGTVAFSSSEVRGVGLVGPHQLVSHSETMRQAVIMLGSSVLGYLGAVGLFVGGIGLLKWRRWGHRTTLSFAVLEAAHFIAVLAAIAMNLVDPVHHTEFGFSQVGYRIIHPMWIMLVILGLAFFLAQIIILTRPGILAPFRQPAGPREPIAEGNVNVRPPLSPKRRVPLGVLVLIWTAFCWVLYVVLWGPDGIDSAYWPYHGETQNEVALEPTVPFYRRLIIREEREMSRLGNQRPNLYVDGHQKTGLVKLTYTFELEPIKGKKQRMVVDALNNMAWSYVIDNAEYHSGPLLDASVVADWLRAGSTEYPGLEYPRPAAGWDFTPQTTVIVGIMRRAANDDFSGFVRFIDFQNERRPSVCRLDQAVGVQMVDPSKPHPFRAWSASENVKWDPKVPILYVGVPVMLIIWIGGLWLISRWRRRATSHAPDGQDREALPT